MNGKLRNMTSIYLEDDNKNLLLLYREGSRVVKNSYIGTAGGHFEKDELNDAKACVIRELYEETGLTLSDINNPELRYVTLRLKKEEIRQNYYFFAKLKNKNNKINSNEGQLKWFNYLEIPKIKMPHTAKYVLVHYVKEGNKNDKLYGGIAVRDDVVFTELNEFE